MMHKVQNEQYFEHKKSDQGLYLNKQNSQVYLLNYKVIEISNYSLRLLVLVKVPR